MKTVVLGGPGPQKVVVEEDKLDPYGNLMQPNVHGMETWFGSSSCGPIERAKGETVRGELAKAKPRKTVSINHTVEFIDDYLSNKKRKRKAMEQWPSMDIEDDEIKPLRSILKVAADSIGGGEGFGGDEGFGVDGIYG
ncbi:hypothetical protein Tco_1288737 [Tanacetum coccineum]